MTSQAITLGGRFPARGLIRLRRAAYKRLVLDGLDRLATTLRTRSFGRRMHQGLLVERDVRYLPEDAPAARAAAASGQGDAHLLDIYKPAHVPEGTRLPVLVYIHGGGFCFLSKDSHWLFAARFARAGFLVYTINYRLAPAHRYPAAIDDAASALAYIDRRLEADGGDRERLVISGESAGGNLTTGLTIACAWDRPEPWAQRAHGSGLLPVAIIPACGALQLSDPGRLYDLQRPTGRPMPRWMKDRINQMVDATLPTELPTQTADGQPVGDIDFADPVRLLEALDAPGRPLPDCFSFVGTRDPLEDDTPRLTAAWQARGGHAEHEIYEGGIHVFHALVFRPQARAAWQRQFDFLKAAFDRRGLAQPEPVGEPPF